MAADVAPVDAHVLVAEVEARLGVLIRQLQDGAPTVTALPSNPVDGQECNYVANDVNGIVWRLRYRAASASPYRWEAVGSSALYATASGGQGFTTNWTDLTGGPALTLPLAGDYRIAIGAQLVSQDWTTGGYRVAYGTTPIVVSAISRGFRNAGTGTADSGDYSRRDRANAIPAGTVICGQGEGGQGAPGTVTVNSPWIEVHPIRVG